MVVSPRKFEIQVLTIYFWWNFWEFGQHPIHWRWTWMNIQFSLDPIHDGSLLLSRLEISFQLMATAFFPHLGTDNFDVIDQHQSSQDLEKNVLTWLLWETLLSVVRLWVGRVLLLSFVASLMPARGPRYQTADLCPLFGGHTTNGIQAFQIIWASQLVSGTIDQKHWDLQSLDQCLKNQLRGHRIHHLWVADAIEQRSNHYDIPLYWFVHRDPYSGLL